MIVDHVAAAERLPCRSRAATMCTVVVRSVGVQQRAMLVELVAARMATGHWQPLGGGRCRR
jgi:hypothetical protein